MLRVPFAPTTKTCAHALIERLKNITETDDEARDKAITEALLDVGGVAPESWREIYEKTTR